MAEGKYVPMNPELFEGVKRLSRFYESLRRDPVSSEVLTLALMTGGPKRGQMQAFFWTDVHDDLSQRIYVVGEGSQSTRHLTQLRVDLLDVKKMAELKYDPMFDGNNNWDKHIEGFHDWRQRVLIKTLPSFGEPIPYRPEIFIQRLKRDLPELS